MDYRPDFITDKHLEYLDRLRESRKARMFGAGSYLMKEFPDLTKEKAGKILSYWMDTYWKRHSV